jgi:hypothetical protein
LSEGGANAFVDEGGGKLADAFAGCDCIAAVFM